MWTAGGGASYFLIARVTDGLSGLGLGASGIETQAGREYKRMPRKIRKLTGDVIDGTGEGGLRLIGGSAIPSPRGCQQGPLRLLRAWRVGPRSPTWRRARASGWERVARFGVRVG